MNLNFSLVLCLIFSGACLVINRPFLEASEKKQNIRALWLKLSASLCFMAITVISLFTENVGYDRFWLVVTLGLLFGMLGDVLLAFRHIFEKHYELCFTVGAISFVLEHLLFIGYFVYVNENIVPVATLFFIISFATATFVLAKTRVNGGRLQIGLYVYIAIVCLMSATAVATAIKTPSVGSLMFALGSVCFVASDTTICVYNFSKYKEFKWMILLHYLYYPAQLLIALSVIFM